MKVLFVYSTDNAQAIQSPLSSWSSIQFGISYISSMLKSHGHQTKLVVLGSNQSEEDNSKQVSSCLLEYGPRLICFTAVFSQYAFIKTIATLVKNLLPETHLLIGGPHATLRPDEVISGPFDSVCIGEGEMPSVELCEQLEHHITPHGIANLWIKSLNGAVEKNKPRDFLQDLDGLPFPDREMWKPWMKAQLNDELALLLGRGCPYDCTYCSNHALRKIAPGKYVRFRSPENIIQEVAFLHDNYPFRKFYFEVETIAVNKPWMIDLCRQLETFNSTIHHSISYGCNFRISTQSMDETLFIAMKQANFSKINIGLESGSERVRREVFKRNYSNNDFLKVVSLARKHGLKIYLFNMIGLPGESLSDHKDTVLLNRQCQPDGHYTGIFYPYPGTELYNTCVQKGLILGAMDAKKERRQPIIENPNFTKTQIQRAYTWFNFRVYRGHKPLVRLLAQLVLAKIRSNPIANSWFQKIVSR